MFMPILMMVRCPHIFGHSVPPPFPDPAGAFSAQASRGDICDHTRQIIGDCVISAASPALKQVITALNVQISPRRKNNVN